MDYRARDFGGINKELLKEMGKGTTLDKHYIYDIQEKMSLRETNVMGLVDKINKLEDEVKSMGKYIYKIEIGTHKSLQKIEALSQRILKTVYDIDNLKDEIFQVWEDYLESCGSGYSDTEILSDTESFLGEDEVTDINTGEKYTIPPKIYRTIISFY